MRALPMLLFMLPRYCWGVTQKSAQNLSLFSGGFIIELKNLAFSACCYSQVYLVPPPLCHWIFNISSLENIRSLSRVWVSALIQLCQRWARLRCLRATFCPWKICSSYCPHRTTREKNQKEALSQNLRNQPRKLSICNVSSFQLKQWSRFIFF